MSSPGNSAPAVRHNAAASRYEITVDGHLAVADYVLADGRMVMTHTFVPPELRGRGIAELLVRTALDEARQAGRRVVPQCSYVGRFVELHPAYRDLLA